jgi:hypothetical protein
MIMIRPDLPTGRRTLLRFAVSAGFLGVLLGCENEGAGTIQPSPEAGGQKRLKKMQDATEKAAESKASRRR